MKNHQITLPDDKQLTGATSRFGSPIPVYDDGFGPLWIHRDSMGISGIVRAKTWEDAYSICEDEFFPEADESVAELTKEYGFRREHVKIVRCPLSGEREVQAGLADYPFEANGIEFVRWETRETPDVEAWMENELFQEAYGFRPNGANVRDKLGHGIYAKDLNGDSLEPLTEQLRSDLEIVLTVADY